jgi:hypothetical protein
MNLLNKSGLENTFVSTLRDFAVESHGDQPYGTRPYYNHLDEVAQSAWDWGYQSPELLAACFGHDLFEDTIATPEDLIRLGTPLVVIHFISGVSSYFPEPQFIKLAKARSNPGSHVTKLFDARCNKATSSEPPESDSENERLRRLEKYGFYVAALEIGLPKPEEVASYIDKFNRSIGLSAITARQ